MSDLIARRTQRGAEAIIGTIPTTIWLSRSDPQIIGNQIMPMLEAILRETVHECAAEALESFTGSGAARRILRLMGE